MSKLYNISNIPKSIAPKIAKDLLVEPKKDFGFQQSYFVKAEGVEAFAMYDNCPIDIMEGVWVALPFSYGYHNLSIMKEDNVEQISYLIPEFPKCEMKFVGELLERQREIREESIEILNRTKSLVLSLHTGFGKTIFALYLASRIKKKILVLCHRKVIIEQWIQSGKKYLKNITIDEFGNKKKGSIKEPDMLVANVLNIAKYPPHTFTSYGLVIIDEIHTICTTQFSRALTRIFPQYIIGLSATPHRTDGMDKIIELYCGPEMIIRKLWRQFNVYIVRTGFIPEVTYQQNGTLDWNSYLESQSKDNDRNNLIVKLIRFFSNRTILVLVKRREHAEILYNKLYKIDHVDTFYGNDLNPNYNSRILIATTSKGGVGFDHPGLDMLITAADVEENYLQYVGRVFRKDTTIPIILDLVDELKTGMKHASTRSKVCKEIGGTVRQFHTIFPDFNIYTTFIN